ncbi:hypothetical protein HX13_00555 [Chryseobacterium sp. P1-3]|uniref:hypothetical protein n=1 Tax=Chryseobacterium sp. (strain P1-3) TaxID=1517683 RepID=UPI0004E68F5F|nr:hypothetical protein [Chryseobacterium sp. P1-3]KFF76234.1 hypothetical protein HX13_00555 [Chryseobacterium sp. P1-3]
MKKLLILIVLITTVFSQAQVKKKTIKPKIEKEWVNPVKLTKEERNRPYMDDVLKTRDSLTPKEAERRRKNIAAGNPFAKYGYYPKIATLSRGKYLEFHDKDSIVIIGSVKYNTKQQKVIEVLDIDLSDPDAQPIGDTHGMWMSPDPLSEEFPSWSPYNFVFSNPLKFTDPTGMAPEHIDPSAIFEKNKDGSYKNPKLVQAWNQFATSKEGQNFLKDYASPGQVVAGHKYSDVGGKYDKAGIDLSFDNGTALNNRNSDKTVTPADGITTKKEENGRMNFQVSITDGPFTDRTLETVTHELGIHVKLGAADYFDNKKIRFFYRL